MQSLFCPVVSIWSWRLLHVFPFSVSYSNTSIFNYQLKKSQAFTFSKEYKIKRKPTFKINGTSNHHVYNFKLQRLSIDQHLNLCSHTNYLQIKLVKFYYNSTKLTNKSWGRTNHMLKMWYSIILVKNITYGAAIGEWG